MGNKQLEEKVDAFLKAERDFMLNVWKSDKVLFRQLLRELQLAHTRFQGALKNQKERLIAVFTELQKIEEAEAEA